MRWALSLVVAGGVALATAHVLGSQEPSSGSIDSRFGSLSYAGDLINGELAYWRGLHALRVGNSDDAVDAFTAAAARHHAGAMLRLARMYRDGDGVAVDRDEALMWYVPLALSDHAVAQFELAQMIEADAAGPNDRDAALHWYRKAAAAGDDQAARRLAADKPGGGREGETPSLASQVGSGAAARP